jgi:two-component system cell cycle sensor histidine kinase/response regulator CckA
VGSVQDYAIVALHRTGHILSWNVGAQRIKGYATEEILGRHFSVFCGLAKVRRDLTERRRGEELLRETAARYRQMVELSPDGIVVHGEGRLRYVNAAMAAMLGYESPESLVGAALVDFLPPAGYARMRARIGTTVPGRGPEVEEFQLRRRDGRLIEVETVTVPTTFNGLPAVQTVVRDITKRKLVEEALRESEELLRETQQIGVVGSWALNARTGMVTWSDELYRIYGFESRSVTPSYELFLSLIPADDRARVEADVAEAARRGGSFAHDHQVVWPDGAVRALHCRGRATLDASGALTRIIGMAQDITERVAAEAELRRAHGTLATLLAAAPVAITAVDAHDHVTMWNLAAERLFGWRADEVLGKPLPTLTDDTRDEFIRLRGEAGFGLTVTAPTFRRRKDGSIVHVYLSSAALRDGAGADLGAIALFIDMTEHRRLEEQLRQAQKMEAVGKLAGGLAHDFNNILAAITGYAELLQADLTPDDPQRNDVEEILKGTRRAATLTRQLLAFSRQQVLQPEVLELNELVADSAKMLRPLLGPALYLVTLPAAEPVRIFADRTQMEQVLMNLALNAREAMPDGGTLSVEAGMTPDGNAGLPAATLVVSDTGHGMSAEVQARIFEPFFTTKELGRGNGLGLATVHGIIQQSGGTISVATSPGRGTTFTVTLPLTTASVAVTPVQRVTTQRGGGSVLLVEDEEGVRAIGRRVLERAGYRVLVARHGADALRLLEEHGQDIDLLLSDVLMPEMGGIELVERALMQVPGLRIVLMSGYTNTDVGAFAERLAIDGFLQKPFTTESLLDMVSSAIRLRQASP